MTIEVELFRDDLGTHFEKLNREWIECHFEVEPRDREGYRKHGLRTTRLSRGDEYERSNIEMTLDLTP
jgi:hypothetical protein